MNQHICIVTSAHPLDDVRVNSKIAGSFLEHGFRVSWVGPETSYFADVADRDERIAYHLTRRPRNRLDRLRSARRVARKAREVTDVDWYYSPDPDAAEVAVRLARGSRAKALFDIHEIFHGALLDRWLSGRRAPLVREYVRKRVARTASRSDLVMGVSESVLRPYVDPTHAQVSVRNCAPAWFADHALPRKAAEGSTTAPEGRTTFMHGKAFTTNGTLVVLEALARLGDQQGSGRVIMFPSTGPGASPYMPNLADRIERLGVADSVWLHDAVTHEEMPSVTGQCEVGMVAYGRGLGEDSLPNRLFEYMASGLAVLAPSYAVEIVRIIEAEDIGLAVDFEDPTAVAEAMSWFIANPERTREMGLRARQAFMERHNWDAEFSKLLTKMHALQF